MNTHSALILSSLLACAVTTAATPSQSLPKVWNRRADWIDKKNPSPDSKGNLMWHCTHRRSFATLASNWSKDWGGWVYTTGNKWSGTGPITRSQMHHQLHNSTQYAVSPEIWFRNTTTKSFLLKLEGKLGVLWVTGTKPFTPKVKIEIVHMDWSQGFKSTSLLSTTIGANTTLNVTTAVSTATVRMDPKDVIKLSFRALVSGGYSDRATLVDKDLNYVRKSVALATETQRYATPKNPLILHKGRSSRPIIGKTWDPYLSKVPAGATSNIIAIGVTKKHMPMPYGTLLTDPILLVYGPVGADFKFPIANNVAFAGILATLQGATITKTGALLLSNALDVQVGDF